MIDVAMLNMIDDIGAHAGGPIRGGMTLLTTNENVGLNLFWA